MLDFHFIRPWWLLAILALIYAIILLRKHRISRSGWHQLLPPHLAKVLVDGNSQSKPMSLTLPFIIGLLAIIALAGPTWKKLPQPVYQLARGSVLIMDMSYSMYATDLSPNRLTRARYKAIDLLEQLNEGEIGLIAYAGDAFTISPLTEDINNIELLLPSLSPELMPELGSNPFAAFVLADEMLSNAGHIEGDIYWFTDGIDNIDIQDLTEWSREHNYRVNILGIGTTAGAPIKLSNGQLMKDDSGAIIIPKLTESALNTVAAQGDGQYVRINHSSDDIEQLIAPPLSKEDEKKSENSQTGDQWQEFGPYLLLAVLPLMLVYFRRGSILVIAPLAMFLFPSKPVYADFWSDLWKTKDQQGQQLYQNGEFAQAAEKFDNPIWQGSAHYQAGNFEEALAAFKKGHDAEALYNQGNALAKLQQIEQAIAAYDKAIKLQSDHQDAIANKALLEKLKEQQDQQQQNQDNQNQDDEQQDDQQKQENSDQDQEQQNQENENQESQDDQQQQSDQDSQQEKQSEEQKQNEQQQKEQSEQEKQEQEEQEEQEEQQAQESEQQEQSEQEKQQQQAQMAKAQQDKETEQKHKQLLNKVTDDPYLLLRNKMQLEYQKRRQNRSSVGVKKKW